MNDLNAIFGRAPGPGCAGPLPCAAQRCRETLAAGGGSARECGEVGGAFGKIPRFVGCFTRNPTNLVGFYMFLPGVFEDKLVDGYSL